MKKILMAVGIFVLAYTSVLTITFNSFENDLKLSAVGLSWEDDSIEIMERMEKVQKGTKAKIMSIMGFPIANYSISANGGVLPLWGALGQSFFLALLLFPLARLIFKSGTE